MCFRPRAHCFRPLPLQVRARGHVARDWPRAKLVRVPTQPLPRLVCTGKVLEGPGLVFCFLFLFLTKFRHHNCLNVSVKGDCEMCGDGCLHDNCPKSFPGLKVSFLYLTLFLSVLGPVPSWICLEFSFFVLTV